MIKINWKAFRDNPVGMEHFQKFASGEHESLKAFAQALQEAGEKELVDVVGQMMQCGDDKKMRCRALMWCFNWRDAIDQSKNKLDEHLAA